MYTKREIDKMLNKAFFKQCSVSSVKLNEEDIHNYKLSLKKNKDNYSNEPAKKKPKLDTNKKDDTEEVPIVINYEESTESSKSPANNVIYKIPNVKPRKTKSSSAKNIFKKNEVIDPSITMPASKPKQGIASTSTKEVPIVIDDEESTESSNSSANYVFQKNQAIDPRKTMSSSKSKNEIASTSTEEVLIVIDDEESTEPSNSSAKNLFKKNEVVDPKITMPASKPKHGIAFTSTEEVTIVIDDEESTESSNSSANYVFQKNQAIDPRKTMSSSKSKNEIASTSTEEVLIVIDDEESTESSNSSAKNLFKKNEVVDPKIIMHASKPKHGIAFTSTEEVPIVIDDEESTESSNSSNVLAKISVIDPRKMMNDDKYIWYINVFLDKKPVSTSDKTVKSALNENFKLIEIEKLYKKYYSKFVQDTIVVIANLYIIYAMTYIRYVAKLRTSLEDKSEAEKLKKTYDAKLFHEKQTKILEKKVKINLTNVVSLFFESDFEKAFKMFFLSILTVVRVLKQPKFWKGDIFKNLSQFLLNCLKNYELNDSRVFSMLQSNDFRLDCINIMLEIEGSKDNDPGITDRLTLFFVTSVNSQKYFQKIVDAIVSESEVDLEILIDEASFQCCVNSMFKDPIYPSNVQESIDELPVTSTIQIPINSDEQHSVIAKSPDGTFQDIPGLNRKKSQTIGNTAVESSTVTNQPLTKSSHESRTQEVCSETYTPKVIQITRVKSVHSTQNNNTVANRPTAKGLNIAVHDQQVGPSSRLQIPSNSVGTDNKFSKIPFLKCFLNSCKNNVNLMCSHCKVVKYCSRACQKRHWYLEHIYRCDELLKKRKQLQKSRL
ncbi:uncharacterized protein LOC100572091 [Acyrthosiphon pisum]|uniref:MYND-type domain-containing protein n=1 Tax=Acyrthosiphon pisum TaxID=7029 RepID=A0A8R2B4V4_ACYPI|nr:uncharacterized protein LOC100572091 [Acyrthosiphon pisum]|eukprot:XP_008181857.2 PREDICTED: uncharacterized protein LOC100572091 [Acyrthosiphon pisum]